MSSDDEVSRLYDNPAELKRVQQKRHKNRSPPTHTDEEIKRKIFNTSPNAQEELRKKYEKDIINELDEHDSKRFASAKQGRTTSPLIPIPPPNKHGGIKRKTKRKRSMKKNKKSKKQKVKRRTNKKRSNKKRKTRRSNKKR